jgi:hypothetical protein
MKYLAAAFVLVLTACGSAPWERGSAVSESTCTAACDVHFSECPRIFAGFPERGKVECPAEHENCLRSCSRAHPAPMTSAASRAIGPLATPASISTPAAAPQPGIACTPSSNKEARLRELQHLYQEGLIVDDVYKDRQRAILADP